MEYFTFENFLEACTLKKTSVVSKLRVSQQRNLDKSRANKRLKCLTMHRNISDSPIPPTPIAPRIEKAKPVQPSISSKALNRDQIDRNRKWMERYTAWKQQREQARLEAQKNKKPPFRLGTKVIDHRTTCCQSSEKFKFATKNHKFKAPSNVQPISLGTATKSAATSIKLPPKSNEPTLKRKLVFGVKSLQNKSPKRVENVDAKIATKENTEKAKVQAIAVKMKFTTKSTQTPSEKKTETRNSVNVLDQNVHKSQDTEEIGDQQVRDGENTAETMIVKQTPRKSTRKTEFTSNLDGNDTKTPEQITTSKKSPQNMWDVVADEDIGQYNETPRERNAMTLRKRTTLNKTPKKSCKSCEDDNQDVNEAKRGLIKNTPSKKSKRKSTKIEKNQENYDSSKENETSELNKTKTPKKRNRKKEEANIMQEIENAPMKTPTKSVKSAKSQRKLTESNERVADADDIGFVTAEEGSILDESNSILHEMSSVYAMNISHDVTKTPENDKQENPVYVSPFVTMSRGKSSASKEFRTRMSLGGYYPKSPEVTGVQASGAYFYKLLDDEIQRLREVCAKWTHYQNEENPPADACDMINVPIGQSNLLISKKMAQFRQLIDNNIHGGKGPMVTCADLHGFWDIVMMQVENINKRFENLEQMRMNEWEEILHVDKKTPKRAPRVKPIAKRIPSDRNAKTSALSALIRAARNKKNELKVTDNTQFEGAFFTITSPRKTPSQTSRKSLLRTVLDSEKSRSRKSSPGLAMLSATKAVRIAMSPQPETATPVKSILKIDTPVSATKKTKNVLFKEDAVEVIPEYADDENDTNAENLSTPENQMEKRTMRKNTPRISTSTPRRSTRIRTRRESTVDDVN